MIKCDKTLGGEKGARKAAAKRERQVQYFKQMKSAVGEFGLLAVAKYVLEQADGCDGCQELLKSYVEKAMTTDSYTCPECGYTGKMKMGKKEKSADSADGEYVDKAKWMTLPKGWTPQSLDKFWRAMGGDVSKCMARIKGKVTDPGAFCASLKDRKTGSAKWRGKEEKKSFAETTEETLAMLEKDTDLEDIDLTELEQWLEDDAGGGSGSGEPTPTETTTEPPPAEPEPEGTPVDSPDLPNTFNTLMRRQHAIRQVGVLNVLPTGVGFHDYHRALAQSSEGQQDGQDD